MKVYVKVKASEELPETGGQYHIILESFEKEFCDQVGIKSGTNTSAFFWGSKDEWWKKDSQLFPDYWLKEIDLPDEDEIVAMSGNLTSSKLFNKAKLPKEIKDAIYEVAQDSFKIGANYILNDLK